MKGKDRESSRTSALLNKLRPGFGAARLWPGRWASVCLNISGGRPQEKQQAAARLGRSSESFIRPEVPKLWAQDQGTPTSSILSRSDEGRRGFKFPHRLRCAVRASSGGELYSGLARSSATPVYPTAQPPLSSVDAATDSTAAAHLRRVWTLESGQKLVTNKLVPIARLKSPH